MSTILKKFTNLSDCIQVTTLSDIECTSNCNRQSTQFNIKEITEHYLKCYVAGLDKAI